MGKILARQLKRPFTDLDHVIEANAGKSIVRIMEEQGEGTFRDLESEALKEAVGQASSATDKVIALGGGALLREENRKIAERAGSVVLLNADLETLLDRLNTSSRKRPLLAGDLREKLNSLLAKRKEHYDSFPARIDVNQEPEELAWRIQVDATMTTCVFAPGRDVYSWRSASLLGRAPEGLWERKLIALMAATGKACAGTESFLARARCRTSRRYSVRCPCQIPRVERCRSGASRGTTRKLPAAIDAGQSVP